MNGSVIRPSLLNDWRDSANWYEREAWYAISRGWFREIIGTDGSLYLLRCWLTEPTPEPDSPEKFESGNATLLHYFPQPDADRAFHDHPWDFRTTILCGGYVEMIPRDTWPGRMQGLGPSLGYDGIGIPRKEGDTVERRAEDLHLVHKLHGDECWTLVRTGPRRRQWGFHPAGEPWQEFTAWLAARDAKKAG